MSSLDQDWSRGDITFEQSCTVWAWVKTCPDWTKKSPDPTHIFWKSTYSHMQHCGRLMRARIYLKKKWTKFRQCQAKTHKYTNTKLTHIHTHKHKQLASSIYLSIIWCIGFSRTRNLTYSCLTLYVRKYFHTSTI